MGKRKTIAWLIGSACFITCGTGVMWRGFCSLISPVEISSSDPDCRIFVNGKEVLNGTGDYHFNPWYSSYEIDIRGKRHNARYRIFPFDSGSDSGVVDVGTKSITVSYVNEKLPS